MYKEVHWNRHLKVSMFENKEMLYELSYKLEIKFSIYAH